MNQTEYDAKFRKAPGALQPAEQALGQQGPTDLAAANAEHPEQEQAELEAAGYDYGGEEPWIEAMRMLGRRA